MFKAKTLNYNTKGQVFRFLVTNNISVHDLLKTINQECYIRVLPQFVPLRTCPLSQTRPTMRTAGGIDESYSKTTPLTLRVKSVSFREARMLLDICLVVWFRPTTEVLLGSGTFTANFIVRGTFKACSLSAMSLLRRFPLCPPHSTSTFSIVHFTPPSQPPTVPKYCV